MTLQDTIKTILDLWITGKSFPNEITINYEDIINNPKERIKDLLEFCNVEFEKLFKFSPIKASVKTISSEQVRQPCIRQV